MQQDSGPLQLPFQTVSLAGQLGAVLCWWFSEPESLDHAAEAVLLIPRLLTGRTEGFGPEDWSLFDEAPGALPSRTSELDRVYQLAHSRVSSDVSGQPTECFDADLLHRDDDDEE